MKMAARIWRPFSFYTVVCANPMIVAFSPMIRSSDGGLKDTVRNIEREREFIINVATEANIEKISESSIELPFGADEMDHIGLGKLEGKLVNCQRLKESPIHLECKYRDQMNFGHNKGQGRIIFGEVVYAHLEENLMLDGYKIDTDKLKPVGRGAGADYIKSSDRFIIERKV